MDRPKNGTSQAERPIVSIRKREANSRNALKSTGPRTLKGKTYSRRNAIKHGLFARQDWSFTAFGENPEEYEKILSGLRAEYQPVGTPEELEVEYIAICWWKRKRAWRYENATNNVALRDIWTENLPRQVLCSEYLGSQEHNVIRQLRNAKKEIEDAEGISEDLKQRILEAVTPKFKSIWSLAEKEVRESLSTPPWSERFAKLSLSRRSSLLALKTLAAVVGFLEKLADDRAAGVYESAVAEHLLPHEDDLRKLLRYGAAIDRNLDRALDRLERLQRRRQGEMIPPRSACT
jgi:hypothetical protein